VGSGPGSGYSLNVSVGIEPGNFPRVEFADPDHPVRAYFHPPRVAFGSGHGPQAETFIVFPSTLPILFAPGSVNQTSPFLSGFTS
jgi:hypothetical protein